jgi:hypothetical protein
MNASRGNLSARPWRSYFTGVKSALQVLFQRKVTKMADQPFVGQEQRPDLTINMEGKVGELTVRDLVSVLGGEAATSAKLPDKQVVKEIKEPVKEAKEPKDAKDVKDHKEPKDHKDQKEQKDHKEPKDHKDQKEQKDHKDTKDQKDQKEQKDHKDPKEPKDTKDAKDAKEPKDTKDHKDLKDRKENIKDHKEPKEPVDLVAKAPGEAGPAAGSGGSEIDALIKRVSGLEQSVQDLQKR